MIMMMVVTTMSMMSMMKVEAFGGLSARNHVMSVASSCSSSPFMRLPSTGRACKPTKNNRQQFQMSSNGDDAQKDTTDTTAADAQSNDLYEDGGDLYDDEVSFFIATHVLYFIHSFIHSFIHHTFKILYPLRFATTKRNTNTGCTVREPAFRFHALTFDERGIQWTGLGSQKH